MVRIQKCKPQGNAASKEALHPAFQVVTQRLLEQGRSRRQEASRAIERSWSGFEEFAQPTKQPYSDSIYRVLKQVHPDTELSAEAATVMHDLVVSTMKRVASDAAGLHLTFTETKAEYADCGDVSEMIIGWSCWIDA